MSDYQPQHPALKRLQAAWLRAALFGFNFFVLFVALNVVLIFVNKHLTQTQRPTALPPPPPHGAVAATRATPPPMPPPPHDPSAGRPTPNAKRDPDTMDTVDMAAYAGLPDPEVEQMLDDFNDFGHQGYVYLPWVQFGPPAFKSPYFNMIDPPHSVSDHTPDPEFVYRKSVLDPSIHVDAGWPVLKVFVLGGSTTFGSRVSDEWTLPSELWNELQKKASASPTPCRIDIVNWGRPWYYSSQELVLLRRLIRTGRKPDVVVFFDGLNDCNNWFTMGDDRPVFTDKLAEIYHLNQFGKDWLSLYSWVPIVKFAFIMRQRIAPVTVSPAGADRVLPLFPSEEQVQQRADDILACYRDNVREARALCQQNHVRSYFFWQPCPFYHYDLSLHRAVPQVSPGLLEVFGRVYEQVGKTVPETVDLGRAIDEYGHKKLFVDIVHYNPDFHAFLARKMAAVIDVSPPTASTAQVPGAAGRR